MKEGDAARALFPERFVESHGHPDDRTGRKLAQRMAFLVEAQGPALQHAERQRDDHSRRFRTAESPAHGREMALPRDTLHFRAQAQPGAIRHDAVAQPIDERAIAALRARL